MAERGHSLESIKASIEARKPDFDAYIDPQKKKADMIIQVRPGLREREGGVRCCRWQDAARPGVESSPLAVLTCWASTAACPILFSCCRLAENRLCWPACRMVASLSPLPLAPALSPRPAGAAHPAGARREGGQDPARAPDHEGRQEAV